MPKRLVIFVVAFTIVLLKVTLICNNAKVEPPYNSFIVTHIILYYKIVT